MPTLALLALLQLPGPVPAPAAPPPPTTSPQAAHHAAYLDALKLAALDEARKQAAILARQKFTPDAPFYRYFWVPVPPAKRADFLLAFRLHLNLLSDQGNFATPALIAPDVLRIDVRDLGWDRRLLVWEKLAPIDFYFHSEKKLLVDQEVVRYRPDRVIKGRFLKRGVITLRKKAGQSVDISRFDFPEAEAVALRQILFTEAPVVNAEWFFVQTAKQVSIRNVDEGVGYYEWLGLKTRNDFFELTGVDEKGAAKRFREWRAAVQKSGISQQSRQVVALGAQSGKVFGTLDTITQKGRGQPVRNLRRGEFLHQAEEWYGVLPNGLWVTFLANAQGQAQAKAPPEIGGNSAPLNTSNNPSVEANLACIQCHGSRGKDMLMAVEDLARKRFRKGGPHELREPNKKVFLELQSAYLRDFDEVLDDGRREYARAVRRLTATEANPLGLTDKAVARLYAQAWDNYVQNDVRAEDAARELGVTREKLTTAVATYSKARGGGDVILSAFIDKPPDVLTRLEWEDSYALALALVLGVRPPEEIKKVK